MDQAQNPVEHYSELLLAPEVQPSHTILCVPSRNNPIKDLTVNNIMLEFNYK